MSVVSRVFLAGALCAAMGAQAFAAPKGDDPGTTRGRFFHAGKCVVTLGFSGGCDKDEADSKRAQRQAAEPRAAGVTKVSDETTTRHQFARASKCVMSFGFVGHCDRNAPEQSPSASGARADGAPAAPDNSTSGQFKRASKCVVTFGFVGDCDKK